MHDLMSESLDLVRPFGSRFVEFRLAAGIDQEGGVHGLRRSAPAPVFRCVGAAVADGTGAPSCIVALLEGHGEGGDLVLAESELLQAAARQTKDDGALRVALAAAERDAILDLAQPRVGGPGVALQSGSSVDGNRFGYSEPNSRTGMSARSIFGWRGSGVSGGMSGSVIDLPIR